MPTCTVAHKLKHLCTVKVMMSLSVSLQASYFCCHYTTHVFGQIMIILLYWDKYIVSGLNAKTHLQIIKEK